MNSGVFYGDAERVLKTLPPGIVQCCVTSPPYWGLRDYSVAGQFGLEATPDEYIARMVEVFREVWRVLRDDGTVWLNLGDSYCSAGKGGEWDEGRTQKGTGRTLYSRQANRGNYSGLKPKDLCMIPARVALALQRNGAADPAEMERMGHLIGAITESYDTWAEVPWRIRTEVDRLQEIYVQAHEGAWWVRSDIIWSKPNPMPESCTDRPTTAHEHVFLLSKRPRYFYDADAIREEGNPEGSHPRGKNASDIPCRNDNGREIALANPAGRNKRTVWEIPAAPYPGAHFATFPPKLVEPCILAGTSPRACEICGAPWKRKLARKYYGNKFRDADLTKGRNINQLGGQQFYENEYEAPQTIGWQPTCSCGHEGKGRCLVFDPFAGSGTTGEVALKHGRDYLLIELNRDYEKLIRGRLGLFYEEAEAVRVN